LYLENSITGGAFTAARVRICEILAAQAAISLENARLYEKTRREVDLRREAEETLRSVMQGTAAVTGDNFFVSLVSHLSASFKARFAFVTECREPHRDRARTLAFWQDDRLIENIEYAIAGTPCLRVLEGETSFYSDDVQMEFPEDVDLVALGARGFLGVPLYDANRSVIGHIAILDDKPLTRSPQEMSLLAIFAARAGAELERLRAEQDLRLAMEEVEQLKDRLAAENVYLQEEIRQHHNFEEIVGDSPALLRVLAQVEQVAGTDATVLIFGETGTGKELIARAIHHAGARAGSPLVKVNCGAISAGLVESELFGHVRGAFTGAMTGRAGRFELANGGTIFLDEVGELPADTQVKLLRVLQEGEFEPVGSSKTLKTDVRIIAATNRDLQQEVDAGRFRSDLFYRLNVFPVRVPPLRERREDVPLLVMYFLEKFSKKLGKSITSVPAGVMQRLVDYDWAGNIRELQNVIERAIVLAPSGASTLSSSLLPVSGQEDLNEDAEAGFPDGNGASDIREIERKHILSVLEQTAWVIEGPRGAARALNLHPNTLRSRLKKLNIQRPVAR
jgi:transcriptional regulator with GAF, ATPase, and Fis domain